MPTISIRGNEMPASPIRKLAPLADAAKQRGVHVFHLNIGQPDLPTPQAAIDAIRNIDRKVLEYSGSCVTMENCRGTEKKEEVINLHKRRRRKPSVFFLTDQHPVPHRGKTCSSPRKRPLLTEERISSTTTLEEPLPQPLPAIIPCFGFP